MKRKVGSITCELYFMLVASCVYVWLYEICIDDAEMSEERRAI